MLPYSLVCLRILLPNITSRSDVNVVCCSTDSFMRRVLLRSATREGWKVSIAVKIGLTKRMNDPIAVHINDESL